MKTSLTKVTITGADDHTDINHLIQLSREFPWVEWGILVSNSQVGSFRFPSTNWQKRFAHATQSAGIEINVSTHFCGKWVREILKYGEPLTDSKDVPIKDVSQRIQINTHGHKHEVDYGVLTNFMKNSNLKTRQVIFQWDGVNDGIAAKLFSEGCLNVAALFDMSGGAGVLPVMGWPPADEHLPCGYAGGLGPDNVIDQLKIIEEKANGKPFWIDMERNVRTADDSRLDLTKVVEVLKAVEEYRKTNS